MQPSSLMYHLIIKLPKKQLFKMKNSKFFRWFTGGVLVLFFSISLTSCFYGGYSYGYHRPHYSYGYSRPSYNYGYNHGRSSHHRNYSYNRGYQHHGGGHHGGGGYHGGGYRRH